MYELRLWPLIKEKQKKLHKETFVLVFLSSGSRDFLSGGPKNTRYQPVVLHFAGIFIIIIKQGRGMASLDLLLFTVIYQDDLMHHDFLFWVDVCKKSPYEEKQHLTRRSLVES